MPCSLAPLIGEVISVETERPQHTHIEMESPSARGEPAHIEVSSKIEAASAELRDRPEPIGQGNPAPINVEVIPEAVGAIGRSS
jgi:hypothetical protein